MRISEPDMQSLAPPCQTKPEPVSPPTVLSEFPLNVPTDKGDSADLYTDLGVTVWVQARICMVPASHQDPRSPCHPCDASALQEAGEEDHQMEESEPHF